MRFSDVEAIDESALGKGERRKLDILRRLVGPEVGLRAFLAWRASQAAAKMPADRNLGTIAEALWPLVRDGRLRIRHGGYLVHRGRLLV